MPYTVACIRAMTDNFNVEAHVVRWDSKVLTPFSPPSIKNTFYYLRSNHSLNQLRELLKNIDPDLVFVSGWMDSDYLKICREAKMNSVPVVTSADTQWAGSIRQILGAVYARLVFFRYFDFIMIPGAAQFEFAKRIGFRKNQIIFNFYSADINFYTTLYHRHFEVKKTDYPKTILYVGRFASEKNIQLLVSAYIQLKPSFPDWKLVLVGNGPLEKTIPPLPGIVQHPFLPPEQLANVLSQAGVFCLPSKNEPWGVVVHEMAAYGLPLVVSDASGAGTEFVRQGRNGFRFKSESQESICDCLSQVMSMTSNELQEMGRVSNEMALHVSPHSWASELYHIMK